MSYNVLRYAVLAFANPLWKGLANSPPIYKTVPEQFSGKQSFPLMEMAGKQSSNLEDCAGDCSEDCAEAVLKKAVLPAYGNGWQTVLQFRGLCWGLCWSSSQANSPLHLCNFLGNCVLLFGQLCLTACGNG